MLLARLPYVSISDLSSLVIERELIKRLIHSKAAINFDEGSVLRSQTKQFGG